MLKEATPTFRPCPERGILSWSEVFSGAREENHSGSEGLGAVKVKRMTESRMEFLNGRITIDPSVCNGKPTIRGKRITVQTILEYLGAGESEAEILHQYPSLELEDLRACLSFAAILLEREFTLSRVA